MLQKYLIEKKEAHYRMAFNYTKNKEDALDVIQDSIEKALKSKAPTQNINSWFYKILINTAIDHLRKNKKSSALDINDFEHLLESEDNYTNFDLSSAMEKLPPSYKTIVVLRYFEDMKISTIADTLGENISTIKSRLYRALEFLRIELEENENE